MPAKAALPEENIAVMVDTIVDEAIASHANCVIIRPVPGSPNPDKPGLEVLPYSGNDSWPKVVFSARFRLAIVCRFKIMARMAISEKGILQTGSFQRIVGKRTPLLVSVICAPTPEGEMIILGFRQTARPFMVEV